MVWLPTRIEAYDSYSKPSQEAVRNTSRDRILLSQRCLISSATALEQLPSSWAYSVSQAALSTLLGDTLTLVRTWARLVGMATAEWSAATTPACFVYGSSSFRAWAAESLLPATQAVGRSTFSSPSRRGRKNRPLQTYNLPSPARTCTESFCNLNELLQVLFFRSSWAEAKRN